MTKPMTTLESYSEDKCAWDISIDKVSLKDRPQVIDYIESITGLRTLCGRLTREPYRLIWVDHGIINGHSFSDRSDVNIFFNNELKPRGYKLIKLDFNIGGL